MNNQLTTHPSKYFVYAADGQIDHCPTGIRAAHDITLCMGRLSLTVTPEAARELAAHLVAAADCLDSLQGGDE